MPTLTTEKTFETAIVDNLINEGGWLAGRDADYDRSLALFPRYCIDFMRGSQPKQWDKLAKIHGTHIESKVVQRLAKELDLRGTLDVLRNGITDYGVLLRLAFFKPENGLNPDTLALYARNQLHVTRQLHYSTANQNSLDLVLSVNGLPVATAELKNHFTGQDADHAKRQFMHDRDPGELLFRGKARTLVHFAVDADLVYMTTRLDGAKTRFLPFNKGNNRGAGNPANPGGYQTAYLWEEVWARDSWMDIVGRFLHIQTDTIDDKLTGKTHKRERTVFPRYHQLDVVRQLALDARVAGAGSSYLIQHSAGSGKSNSIAWLAYRLFNLHSAAEARVFDVVIVITDRRVLDQQLQSNIYQFEHRTGVVQKIDKDTAQLRDALVSGSGIIITTLQKFPFVLESIDRAAAEGRLTKETSLTRIASRRYALIVDEAHSSQGGEASKKMKEILAAGSLADAEVQDSEEGDDGEDLVRKSMEARGRQPNLSFFAFTATPKYRTLQVFGTPGPDGRPQPFHLYSMRQAIEENFILDVLKNYTTYELYFRLSKAIEDDPELNKKRASIAIGRFVSLHPHNIAQKTEVIIEHFRQVVSRKIGGKAKAMVVTGSRLHALRYYLAFKRYIAEKGYHDIRPLVAFSGKVIDDLFPDGVTEVELNGFSEKALPEKFDSDDYQLLLVASKYQTGFDQPLLHTMYVDRKLNGVLAVQTLSRLNRTHPGKEDTFVLDFANDRDTILQSFLPYYEQTTVDEDTDPNLLYDLKGKLDGRQVYWQSEIDSFCRVFFAPASTAKDQGKLYDYVNPGVDRYRALPPDEQDEFRKQLEQWLRLYAFLSQIMPFGDVLLEKLYAYGKYLSLKLPRPAAGERLQLNEEVALEYYRLQKIADNESIALEPQGEYGLQGNTETGMKREKEEKAHLSEIIHVLNDRFGTDFTDADKLFFDQMVQELMDDETLIFQAQNNPVETFRYGFEEVFIEKLIDRMEQNQDIFAKIMGEKEFGDLVKEWMLRKVYKRINSR